MFWQTDELKPIGVQDGIIRAASPTRPTRARRLESDVSLELVADQALIHRLTTAYGATYRRRRNLLSLFVVAPATESTLRLASLST